MHQWENFIPFKKFHGIRARLLHYCSRLLSVSAFSLWICWRSLIFGVAERYISDCFWVWWRPITLWQIVDSSADLLRSNLVRHYRLIVKSDRHSSSQIESQWTVTITSLFPVASQVVIFIVIESSSQLCS